MKKLLQLMIMAGALAASFASAGTLDNLMKGQTGAGHDQGTIAQGLKEALSIGTDNAVKNVSRVDGYFADKAIKILMPEQIRNVADVLKKVGYQKEVDEFVLSMNRAAEKAAPKASKFFIDAVKEMSFDDARKILNGGDTAATEYFKRKTGDKITRAFMPVISSSMNEVGVTRNYKEMMKKYESVPLVDKQSVDLDRYVADKAVDGLFYKVGEEEKKIRRDPAARVTEVLKNVFGK